MKTNKLILLTPFFYSFSFIFGLYVHNYLYVEQKDLWRPLLFTSIIIGLMLILFFRIFKDVNKAVIISSLSILLFFSYGHIHNTYLPITRHKNLVPIWFFGFVVGTWFLTKRLNKVKETVEAVAFSSFMFLLIPLIQFFFIKLDSSKTLIVPDIDTSSATQELIVTGMPPDIYYIILDAYSRVDILQDHYEFDNSYFIKELTNRGFYVAPCSQSNYSNTYSSLTSSLNLDYLDEQTDFLPETAWKNITLRRIFEALNYTIVSLDNTYSRSAAFDADIFISISNKETSNELANPLLPETYFEEMLMRTSMGLLVLDGVNIILKSGVINDVEKFNKDQLDTIITFDAEEKINRDHYERTLYFLEAIIDLPQNISPKFVFAHLLIPHEPFIFSLEEGYSFEDEVDIGYINNVQFINQRILLTIDDILANSVVAPIIIIQGDHGFGLPPEIRMPILNAYLLPNGGEEFLYETISPVNSFRIIFNYYFKGDYEILDDKSFYGDFKVYDPTAELIFQPNKCEVE